MSDKAVDKMKEQCLELILGVMPLSQLGFIFVMAIILARLSNGGAVSPIDALHGVGLEDLFGMKAGLFWKVGVLILGGAFFLALINTFLIKLGLRRSFATSQISQRLTEWADAANKTVKGLKQEEKNAIQKSVSVELERRIKKYHAKRLLAETMCSIVGCVFFGSLYLVFLRYTTGEHVQFSMPDFAVLCLSIIFWLFLHRSSVKYALCKVIPLQVYLSAASGEIAFFIDAE